MTFHNPSMRGPYALRGARRRKPISIFGFSLREIFLILAITFPAMGTLFPLESYFGSSGLGPFFAQTPLNVTIVLTVVLAYVLWLFAQDVPKALLALRRNWIIFVFILWAMVTSRWAWDPGLSFNRSGRLLVFALYAVYLIEFMPYRRAMQLLLVCLGLSMVVSMLMIVGMPAYSQTTDARGAWRGATQHKNNLGFIAGTTFVASALAFYTRLFDRRLCAGIGGLAALLVLLANSATALFSTVVILGLTAFLLFVVNRSRRPLTTLVTVLLLVGLVVPAILSSGIVFELLNRDSSLTGRADIWAFTNVMIDANPFWGYGHGTWANPAFRKLIYDAIEWPAPHAHNSWLDFRLQLGLPGFCLAVGIWAIGAINLCRLVSARALTNVALPVAVFAFVSIRTYSETIVCDPSVNDVFWVAFFYAAFARGVAVLKTQRRPRAEFRNPGNAAAGGRLAPASLGAAASADGIPPRSFDRQVARRGRGIVT